MQMMLLILQILLWNWVTTHCPRVEPKLLWQGHLLLSYAWLLGACDWCRSFQGRSTHCFETTYLSYECFIQETKYELAGWELPQEHWEIEDSCMLIMVSESVQDGKMVIARKAKKAEQTYQIIQWLQFLSSTCFCSLSITLNSFYQQQKFRNKLLKTEEKKHMNGFD